MEEGHVVDDHLRREKTDLHPDIRAAHGTVFNVKREDSSCILAATRVNALRAVAQRKIECVQDVHQLAVLDGSRRMKGTMRVTNLEEVVAVRVSPDDDFANGLPERRERPVYFLERRHRERLTPSRRAFVRWTASSFDRRRQVHNTDGTCIFSDVCGAFHDRRGR